MADEKNLTPTPKERAVCPKNKPQPHPMTDQNDERIAEQKNRWVLDDGQVIHLLTPSELSALPRDTVIISIAGDVRRVDDPKLGPPDDDTRCGFTAWAVWENRDQLTARIAALERALAESKNETEIARGVRHNRDELFKKRLKEVIAERDELQKRIAALEGERDEALAVFGPGWPHGLVETCQLLQAVDAAMDDIALAESYITDYLNGSVTEILSKRVQRLIERCRMWHDRQKESTIERDQAIAENADLRAALAAEREKSSIYKQAIGELLCAMERYEMEVDESPTREHRAMMERARAALATPQPVERERI